MISAKDDTSGTEEYRKCVHVGGEGSFVHANKVKLFRLDITSAKSRA